MVGWGRGARRPIAICGNVSGAAGNCWVIACRYSGSCGMQEGREMRGQTGVHSSLHQVREAKSVQDIWQDLGPEEMSECEDPEMAWGRYSDCTSSSAGSSDSDSNVGVDSDSDSTVSSVGESPVKRQCPGLHATGC